MTHNYLMERNGQAYKYKRRPAIVRGVSKPTLFDTRSPPNVLSTDFKFFTTILDLGPRPPT